jgi:hypothetical protein
MPDYNAILTYLSQESIKHFTFCPKSDKSGTVIRILPVNSASKDINPAL